ncbi:MAG: AAA family ATPase, partial [Desulfovibrionales bacterium]|nr:AAA family ATPase [Desulfovibrionales bacterium]
MATVLSASQAAQLPGVAALSCGNLKSVAADMRELYPTAKIIILADLKKDIGTPDENAVEAAKLVNGCLAVPDFGPGRQHDDKDFNDLARVRGPETVKACIEAARTAQVASIWDSPADIAAMLATQPEPMQWLVKERIPFARGGGMAALGGTGKTTFLKVLGAGCITGRLPMEEWKVERTGKVVLVLTEDTHAEFHEDLHRLCYGMTTRERELISKNLIVYPLAGKDTRLLTKSPRGVVEKSPLYQSLISKIQAIGGVVLVGLDPALGLTEGDEMNQADQRALGRAVDDLGVA